MSAVSVVDPKSSRPYLSAHFRIDIIFNGRKYLYDFKFLIL